MARFSGQIHSAKFMDMEEKVIEVLYGTNPTELNVFNVPVDYSNNVFKELLQEITIEQVQDSTRKYFDLIDEQRSHTVAHYAEKMFSKIVIFFDHSVKSFEINKSL